MAGLWVVKTKQITAWTLLSVCKWITYKLLHLHMHSLRLQTIMKLHICKLCYLCWMNEWMMMVLAYSTCITVSVWYIAVYWCFSRFSAVVAVCSAEGKWSGTFGRSFQSSLSAEDHTLAWAALFPMGCFHHSQKFGQTTGLKIMGQTSRRRRGWIQITLLCEEQALNDHILWFTFILRRTVYPEAALYI